MKQNLTKESLPPWPSSRCHCCLLRSPVGDRKLRGATSVTSGLGLLSSQVPSLASRCWFALAWILPLWYHAWAWVPDPLLLGLTAQPPHSFLVAGLRIDLRWVWVFKCGPKPSGLLPSAVSCNPHSQAGSSPERCAGNSSLWTWTDCPLLSENKTHRTSFPFNLCWKMSHWVPTFLLVVEPFTILSYCKNNDLGVAQSSQNNCFSFSDKSWFSENPSCTKILMSRGGMG